ncbi:MAG: hypothetical protein ABI321_13550 [Polyangia bacterium]
MDDAAIARRLLVATPDLWRRPGFERPLAGLLLYMAALLVLTGPFLYVTALWIPAHVQPFPAVDGVVATVEELVLLGWALGDFGMTTAIIRAVAARRTTEPETLLPHLRLLVRWQLGVALLVCVLGTVAAPLLVTTRYAALVPALRLRALTTPLLVTATLPAICEALQRYDRQLLLDLADKRLLAVVLPIPVVLWMRTHGWFGDEPARALVGVVIGQAVATSIVGVLGLGLVRRLGVPLMSLLRGSLPSRNDIRALLRFGAGIMTGKAVFFLAGLCELTIIIGSLADYPTLLGIKAILVGRLLQPLWLLWPFAETVVPALSEALAADRRELARAYVVRYLQHGNVFVLSLFALVVGAAPPLLLSYLPPTWHAAARLLPIAGLTGLLLPLTWVGDGVQRACGRSGLNAAFLLGEQLLRLALLVVLMPRFGLIGLFAASALAALLKSIAVLVHTHAKLLPLSLPARTIFVAPIAAGLVVGAWSRGLVVLGATIHAAPLAFLVTAITAFPVAFFVAGLAGGLEPTALAELDAARQMVPLARFTQPFTRFLYAAARHGASLGPRIEDSVLTRTARTERDQLFALAASDGHNQAI